MGVIEILLAVVLICLILSMFPASTNRAGYWPGGVLGTVLLILVVIWLARSL